jgi:hypothetical protein
MPPRASSSLARHRCFPLCWHRLPEARCPPSPSARAVEPPHHHFSQTLRHCLLVTLHRPPPCHRGRHRRSAATTQEPLAGSSSTTISARPRSELLRASIQAASVSPSPPLSLPVTRHCWPSSPPDTAGSPAGRAAHSLTGSAAGIGPGPVLLIFHFPEFCLICFNILKIHLNFQNS